MTNLAILQRSFAATATGDGRPFLDMLADEVRWTIIGATDWSRTFDGKRQVVDALLRPLAAQFDGPNVVTATRFIGDGDVIAVEGRNHSRTKGDDDYPNRYCWVFTMAGGKVVDIVEYCDTQLIERVLTYPARSPASAAR